LTHSSLDDSVGELDDTLADGKKHPS
jgi:hypothetical protein